MSVFLVALPSFCFGQVYKQWGFWLEDTTVGDKYIAANVRSVIVDKEDNIYIMYYRHDEDRKTTIKCFNKNGKERWKKNLMPNTPHDYIDWLAIKLFWWQDRLIALQPYADSTTGFFYKFHELDTENGDVLQTWQFKVPLEISHFNEPLLLPDGNIYFSASVFLDPKIYILKYNFNTNQLSTQNFSADNGEYAVDRTRMCEVNDSLLAFTSITGPSMFTQTGLQINFIRKSDLSPYSQRGIYTGHYFAASLIPVGKTVYLFNDNSYFLFDLESNIVKSGGQFGKGAAVIDKQRNFYYPIADSAIRIEKMDWNGNLLWQYKRNNLTAQHPEYIYSALVNKKVVISSAQSYLTSFDPLSNSGKIVGLRTSFLNKEGAFEAAITENFDTARGRLDNVHTTLDTKGNPITALTFYFYTGFNSSVANTGIYLYKICDNCDTTIKPPPPLDEKYFENYLTISPNPVVNNTLTYNFGIVTPNRLAFYLYDASGKIILTKKYDQFTTGQYQRQIDLGALSLAAGDYILSMKTQFRSYSQKFVYQKP